MDRNIIREVFGNGIFIDWIYDPAIGTGGHLLRLRAAEISFNTADMAAEAGDDALADAMWQVGAMTAHPISTPN